MGEHRPWFIYVLRDPRTNGIRYVGKTVNPKHRLAVHVHYGGQHHTKVSRWIGGLKKSGLLPRMEIVDTGRGDGHAAAERAWIAEYRERGLALLNIDNGGRGMGTHSEETKRKIGDAHRGRRRPAHEVARIRTMNLGRVHSEATRANVSAAQVGRKRSPEAIAKTTAANTGQKRNPEQRARMSAARVGHSVSDATRDKIAASLTGRRLTSESTREKLRAAQRERRDREKAAREGSTHGASEETP